MSFFGITDITTFVLGTIFIVLLPGPNSLFVLTVAVKRGTALGFLGACGIFAGDSVLMVLTALGAASILNTHEFLYHLLRFGGAIYLSWIGLQLLIGAWKKWHSPPQAHGNKAVRAEIERENARESAEHLPHPFYRAFIISLLNPKAIFFFLAFFTQFIDPQYPYPALPFLIQAGIVQICSAIYLTALIFFGFRLAHSFTTHYRIAASLNALVGSLFCGYGIRLALTSSLK